MQFRVDVHWCLIFWFRLRHDYLLYLKRPRRSRGLNLFSLMRTKFLLSRFVANLLEWVLRNVRYIARFLSLLFLSSGLCGLPHLSRMRERQASVSESLTVIFELCPGLSYRLLPKAVSRRSRLAFSLLCQLTVER